MTSPDMLLRVEMALARISPQAEPPRYTLYRLAAAYGVVKLGRLPPWPGGHLKGLLLPLSPTTHEVKTRGTTSYEGQLTLAHEIGHLVFGPQIRQLEQEGRYPIDAIGVAEERLCEGFARCLVATLWQRWAEYWQGGAR